MVARLFRLWYRFRGDLHDRRGSPQPLDRRQLITKSIPLQKQLFALAEAHLDDADREVRNMATALFVHCDRLFTFPEVGSNAMFWATSLTPYAAIAIAPLRPLCSRKAPKPSELLPRMNTRSPGNSWTVH